MSFRTGFDRFDQSLDFVTLDSGVLIDVKSKKDVLSLDRFYTQSIANLGNYYSLIDAIAKAIAESIVKQ
jgi:hypothetical protein